MKSFLAFSMVLLPLSLFAQRKNKAVFADSTLSIYAVYAESLGEKYMFGQQLFDFNYTILKNWEDHFNSEEFNGTMDTKNVASTEDKNIFISSMSRCFLAGDTIMVANFPGLAGNSNLTEIYLKDSVYTSVMDYYSDGEKIFAFTAGGELSADATVDLQTSELLISPESEFVHNGVLLGRITGLSEKYYIKNQESGEMQPRQIQLTSVFKCRIFDFDEAEREAAEKRNK